jgi:hypothetical protein
MRYRSDYYCEARRTTVLYVQASPSRPSDNSDIMRVNMLQGVSSSVLRQDPWNFDLDACLLSLREDANMERNVEMRLVDEFSTGITLVHKYTRTIPRVSSMSRY